jgi:tRNA/tmRNA/rRNA uracil-C5-methylase (TrmA/RlmC/RlmD family)
VLELEAGAVAAGGACVARAPDGRVVFVRHCLPGERVLARLTSVGARFHRADAVEVLTASPDRVQPPCPFAGPGRCGGCDWQHAALPAQRLLKAALVAETLRRVGGIDLQPVVEAVPAACGRDDGLAWRSRLRFGVDRAGRPGFHRHRSTEIEAVAACPIASPEIQALGVEGRRWRGASELEVFAPPGGPALVAVSSPARRRLSLPGPLPGATLAVGAQAAARRHVVAGGAGLFFQVSGGSFWQAHVEAPRVLVAAVLEALRPAPGERAVDLFAGVGLIATHLARAVGASGSVLAVESDPVACADAIANAAATPWLEVRHAPVTMQLVDALPPVELVVLDPPRAGAGIEVVRALARRGAPLRRVVYVACDTATLARDLRVALDAGWTLSSLRVFDLFPMTEHVELLAVLDVAPN